MLVFLLSILFFSCGGSSSTGDPIITPPAKPNLVINAVIVGADTANPYGDGSGVVNFTFTANNNPTLYKISLGNGEIKETTSNTFSYTYVDSGDYTIYVSAYSGNNFISASIKITVEVIKDSNTYWSDEFDGSGAPDSSKWGYDIGRGSNGWGNGEVQYYTSRSENVRVEGGYLIITAKKEDYEGAAYTSARMLTKGKFNFKYGRVDVRAKLPASAGTWPAIWMLGSNFSTIGWPRCGEIDIMEQTGWDKNKTLGTCHWWNDATSSNASYGLNTSVSNSTTAFHVYSVEWSAQNITVLVDDVPFYVLSNSSSLPFNADFFLILNVAMGGSLGGSIDSNFTQSTMEIDYVRVYK